MTILKMKYEQQAEAVAIPEGAPTPEEASVSVGPEAVSEPEADSEADQWSDILDEDELEESEDETEEEIESPVVAEEGEADLSVPEPEPEPTPVPESVSEPEAVVEPEPQVEAPAEPVQEPIPSKEDQRALYAQRFNTLQNSYQLSKADADLMQVEPEAVLPRVLAGVHMSVFNQVMEQVQQQMSLQVPTLIEQDRSRRADTDEFYNRWPKLKDHHAEVTNFAGVWRQMNPQATKDVAVKDIGKHVMIALGYPLEGGVEAPPVNVTPAFSPAPPTSVVPAPAPRRLNQFEVLAEEILEED